LRGNAAIHYTESTTADRPDESKFIENDEALECMRQFGSIWWCWNKMTIDFNEDERLATASSFNPKLAPGLRPENWTDFDVRGSVSLTLAR
jgi:hypothetical protein